MDTAAEVLLIIVSAVLAIFLAFLIATLIYVIKILKQVRHITQHAENVVDSVEAGASVFRRTASPLAVLKIVANIVEQSYKIGKKRR
jgi:uncharacterized protein YoxC